MATLNEPRVPTKQQEKDQQSCIFVATRGTSPDMITVFHNGHMVDLQRYRATSRERNLIEQIKAPIFLEAALAIEIM